MNDNSISQRGEVSSGGIGVLILIKTMELCGAKKKGRKSVRSQISKRLLRRSS